MILKNNNIDSEGIASLSSSLCLLINLTYLEWYPSKKNIGKTEIVLLSYALTQLTNLTALELNL